jgi:hypothetical protein
MEEKSLEEVMTELQGDSNISITNSESQPVDLQVNGNQTISQSPLEVIHEDIKVPSSNENKDEVKPEVQEMIDNTSFMSQNINKGMDVLEKEYVSMERKASSIDDEIDKIKSENEEVFRKIAELELKKEEILKPKDDYRAVIARKLFLIGQKKWKGLEVEFTYVAGSFKDTFNKSKFMSEMPNVYVKYVEKTPVAEYVRTKLNLLNKDVK